MSFKKSLSSLKRRPKSTSAHSAFAAPLPLVATPIFWPVFSIGIHPQFRVQIDLDKTDNHSKKSDLPGWEGTAVGIDLSLDTTQEFSLLLKLLNETFNKAIKERKKARYKKPQFI